MGLRIIQRVREEYGGDAPDAHIVEEMNPFTNSSKAKKALQADTVADSTPNRDSFFHADNEEDIGGSFLADDNDLDGGGFLPGGYDGVDIEDERGPVGSGPLNDSPPIGSILVDRRPPDTDDGKGGVTGVDVDSRAEAPEKASTNGKKSKAGIRGPEGNIPSSPPKRRAAPRRKAARKSETALNSHFFEQESDKDDNSNRGSLTNKEVAVKKPAKRKSKQDRAPTLRPRKST